MAAKEIENLDFEIVKPINLYKTPQEFLEWTTVKVKTQGKTKFKSNFLIITNNYRENLQMR
jgi:hypothetical protein